MGFFGKRIAMQQREHSSFGCNCILVRVWLILIGTTVSVAAQGQAFYFYVYEVAGPRETKIYKTLLSLYPDGTATARIQYNGGSKQQLFLYELDLVDSATDARENTSRYLMSATAAVPLLEDDTPGFSPPRFLFKKRRDSTGHYYEPAGVEVITDNKWFAARTTTMQQKTTDELRNDEPFVSAFYFDTDPFYQQIFAERTRGTGGARAEKLFLFIVANTADSTVGVSARTDLQNVSRLFTNLATDAGISKIFPTYISGTGYSKQAVEAALFTLANQKPSAKDIVIFYYSGHGFRLQSDTSKYPRMSFRTAKNKANKEVGDNIPLEDVYAKINALRPGVSLVIGDCCNADIFENPVLGNDMIRPKGGGVLGTFNTESASKLFFPPTPVSMIIGSVKPGHLSVGHPEIGGYFTHFFLTQLEKSLWGYFSNAFGSFQGKSNASWLRMLVAAAKETYAKSLRKQCGKTERDRCIQQATFSVYPPQ